MGLDFAHLRLIRKMGEEPFEKAFNFLLDARMRGIPESRLAWIRRTKWWWKGRLAFEIGMDRSRFSSI